MSGLAATLTDAICLALNTATPSAKADATRSAARQWRDGLISQIGTTPPPARPARPDQPELRPPRDMKRRGKAHTEAGRIALLHAIAHIELNAIDLACDIIARFTDQDLPRDYFDDWVRVADEEALHFTLLCGRLADFGAAYGDLPAHDGLWEAAADTAHDLLARLAIVPLVLEARGLDVTPPMIDNLRRIGDTDSVAVLERIYTDEITHVAIGQRWFTWVAARQGEEPGPAWQALVRKHYKGLLKHPFNHQARGKAGLDAAIYEPLTRP